MMYERILVALDGSEIAERVLPHVEALARAFGSTVILLRATTSPEKLMAELSPGLDVATPILLDPDEILNEERTEIASYLEGVAGRLRGDGLTIQTDEPSGNAAEEIVQRAKDLGADLIAMTTHGRSGLKRLVFGSVAESVLTHATCPVLLVRVTDA
jgi:nucleotide-binding universal stress UspA family protein